MSRSSYCEQNFCIERKKIVKKNNRRDKINTRLCIEDIQNLEIWRKLVWYGSNKIVVTDVSAKGEKEE